MNLFGRATTQLSNADAPTSFGDAENDLKPLERSVSLQGLPAWAGLAMDVVGGEYAKGSGEFGSIWTRMSIEDHHNFPPDDGSILIPFRDLPENWASAPDTASLNFLDRDFIFPGEQFHILLRATAIDPSGPDIITPFKVAAAMNKKAVVVEEAFNLASNAHEYVEDRGSGSKLGCPSPVDLETKGLSAQKKLEESQSPELLFHESSLLREGHKKRSASLIENFQNSHYYVQISPDDECLSKRQKAFNHEGSISGFEGKSAKVQKRIELYGCVPVAIEGSKFDPHAAGGIARQAVACSALGNGDIVVLLQVTLMADCIFNNAYLEVLQFEQYEAPAIVQESQSSVDRFPRHLRRENWDPTQGLLQWLLPLDRPSSPPPVASINSSPPKISVNTTSNSTIFSFGHLRSSSLGSIPALAASLPSTSPAYSSKDWDSALQDRGTKTEVGSEGLLSFRGAVLEPQRFSAHCGLEGPHVPGKRWRKKVAVFQPIKVESYFTHCNAQDLICVLVENVLPISSKTEEVVIFVDSVNIICQSAALGSPPLPVPIACVEVGQDQLLPGVPLRIGEQQSFLLRPTNPAWQSSMLGGFKYTSVGGTYGETQFTASSGLRKDGTKDWTASPYDSGHYAIVVSCRCSHSESRLHYKHSLRWKPRLPRDLLLSVTLETFSAAVPPNETPPVFKPQVVSVQVTNLTSQDMNLTLLAPSSLANSPLSMVSFPAPAMDSPIFSNLDQQSYGFQDMKSPSTLEKGDESPGSSRSISLPPVLRMEDVIGTNPALIRERIVSAADIVADSTSARTHLWLQSTIPLGCVPAHSTTAVKCDLLPLTDGIITLDTLHLSTNEHDALYIPESPLQIYATSSITTGVA